MSLKPGQTVRLTAPFGRVVLTRRDESSWSAHAPEIPNSYAVGNTERDAYVNLARNISQTAAHCADNAPESIEGWVVEEWAKDPRVRELAPRKTSAPSA
jgi:hypothetical protein